MLPATTQEFMQAEEIVLPSETVNPPEETSPAKTSPPTTRWKPRGIFDGGTGNSPLESGIADTNRIVLNIRLQTSSKPVGEIHALATDRMEQARAEVLGALQAETCFQNFLEADAECRILSDRLQRLKTRAAELEAERLRCAAKPKNQGSRLVAIKQEAEILEAEHEAAQLELQAMANVRETARAEAKRLTNALAGTVARQTYEEHVAAMAGALQAFCDAHAEELTRLAALVQAKKSCNYQHLHSMLAAFALKRLEDGEPLMDGSSKA